MIPSVRKACLVASTVAVVLSVGLTGLEASTASAATTQGVTSNAVTLGLLSDLTGLASSAFNGEAQGAQARIDAQNAAGGVHGRKIKLVVGDDQSSPTNSLTVEQSLVQQKQAFAIMEESLFFSLDYKYLEQAGIPALSAYPIDGGPEWSSPSTSDLVDGAGAYDPNLSAGWQWLIKLLKQEHITKVGCIANGVSAVAVSYCNGVAVAAKAQGIQDVDPDNSVGITQTDMSSTADRIKSSGATGYVTVVPTTQTYALQTALHQIGSTAKLFFPNGYGAPEVEPPTNSSAQGAVIAWPYKTTEVDPSAVAPVLSAARRYTGYKGTSTDKLGAGFMYGWSEASLAIDGLQAAGRNLTTTSFLEGLHGLKSFDADGLQTPVNLAQSKQGSYAGGSAGSCMFAMKVVGKKYVAVSTKPYCTPSNFAK
jgi:branched-chain amino acid transport system substrate-binding protein